MAGTPSHSGGKRPGAGRPIASRTLRTGQQLLMHEQNTDGTFYAMGELLTVEIVSRTKLILKREDGGQIILGY